MDTEDFRDVGRGALFWGVIGCAVLAVLAAAWFGYWALHKSSVNREYQINFHGQAMQAGQIAQARDLENAIITVTDPGQKALFTTEYCGLFTNINPDTVPTDLQTFHAQNCH